MKNSQTLQQEQRSEINEKKTIIEHLRNEMETAAKLSAETSRAKVVELQKKLQESELTAEQHTRVVEEQKLALERMQISFGQKQDALIARQKLVIAAAVAKAEEEMLARLKSKHAKDLNSVREDLAETKNQLRAAESCKRDAQLECERTTFEMAGLRKQLDQMLQEQDEHKKAVLDALSFASESQRGLESCQAELDGERKSHARSKAEIENMRGKLMRLEGDLEFGRRRHEACEADMHTAKERVNGANMRASKLEAELAGTKQMVENLKASNERLVAKYRQIEEDFISQDEQHRLEKASCKTLLRQQNEARNANQASADRHEKAKSMLDDAAQRVAAAQKRMQHSQDAHSQAENRCADAQAKVKSLEVQLQLSETGRKKKKKQKIYGVLSIRQIAAPRQPSVLLL